MQSAAPSNSAREESTPRALSRTVTVIVGKYGSLIVLGLLFVYFSLTANYFLTWGNIVQIFNQAALTSIIAVGLPDPVFVVAGVVEFVAAGLTYWYSCLGPRPDAQR